MTDSTLPGAARTAPGSVDELTARRLGPVRRYFVRRPRAMDRLVMALFAVPGVLNVLVDPSGPVLVGSPSGARTAQVVALLGVVGVGTTALWWRRTRPVHVAAALAVCHVVAVVWQGPSLSNGVALTVYATAANRSPRTAWLTFAATTALCDAVTLARGEAVLVLFPSLLALAIGISVRNRRLHVADIVDRTNALARDRDQHAQLARAAERSRIAREVHDLVAHNLTVMIALADGARAMLDPAPDRARTALAEVGETGRAALADMRRVLGVLHGPDAHGPDAPYEPQPDSTDLVALVERFRAGDPVTGTTVDRRQVPAAPPWGEQP